MLATKSYAVLLSIGLAGCAAPKHGPALAPVGGATPVVTALGEPTPFAATSGACEGPGRAAQALSQTQILGRTLRSEPQGVRFAWAGTSFAVRFRGAALRLDLEDAGGNRFGVSVDGHALAAALTALPGRHCYTLASGLSADEHSASVSRLSEPLVGESVFHSLSPGASGELLATEPPPARRLEVIGDSISVGYGVEGENQYCHFSAATENHALGYAALLASELHAQLHTIAWSGKGVFSNWDGPKDPIAMPTLWARTLPAHADPPWDFAAWQPEAVVLALGSNDFSPNNPDKAPFADAYRAFLERVRQVYPKAAIFCALSPTLVDDMPSAEHARSLARDAIRRAVASQQARGDNAVFYVEHAPISEAEGRGCDWHPSRLTQARMARELRAAFAKNLGW